MYYLSEKDKYMEFNDYILYYFEEDELSDTERELLEDCFYRQKKKMDVIQKELDFNIEQVGKLMNKCLELGGKNKKLKIAVSDLLFHLMDYNREGGSLALAMEIEKVSDVLKETDT